MPGYRYLPMSVEWGKRSLVLVISHKRASGVFDVIDRSALTPIFGFIFGLSRICGGDWLFSTAEGGPKSSSSMGISFLVLVFFLVFGPTFFGLSTPVVGIWDYAISMGVS